MAPAPALGDPAKAMLRYIERCHGRVAWHTLAREFARRQYDARRFYDGLSQLVREGQVELWDEFLERVD
jgi:hypothetical protein